MSHTSNGCTDPEQLDLFATPTTTSGRTTVGISAEVARAQVSPGWWILLVHLFSRASAGEFAITECREVDGELRLQLVAYAPSGEVDPTIDLAPYIDALVRRGSRICGACGRGATSRWRADAQAPTRVVCNECQEELEAGTGYLELADRYYRLDGTRRDAALGFGHANRPPRPRDKGRELGVALPAAELRQLVKTLRGRMRGAIVGQEDVVSRLSLLGACHVGGGLTRGARVLLLGRSGTGKTSSILALHDAMRAEGWVLPFAAIDAILLQSPGWSGGPSIGQVLQHALGDEDPASAWAQHAIVVIDEIHHAGVVHGLVGNMAAKRSEVLASLLALVGGGVTRLGEGTAEWSSQHALVIGAGAFTGLLRLERPLVTEDLTAAGLPLELVTRFDEWLVLRPLPEPALVQLLERWPALVTLTELCTRLALEVRIHPEAIRRAARVVTLGRDGSTARTAGGWLVAALRGALLRAVDDPDVSTIDLTPDALSIPPTATRSRPEPPPDDDGEWDATLVLTRR